MPQTFGSPDFAFLDSGTGGIPYMLELKKKSPGSTCVYLGDTAQFPYGEKTGDQITECASRAIRLVATTWRPRAIVIACNTISVTSLPRLRAAFPGVPIVGTVPAIRLASRVTKNRRIGLLATNATVRHPYNQRLIHDFAGDCAVIARGDPELVAFVEHRLFCATKQERLQAVRPAVRFFAQSGCDTIILGCTHFTHVAGDIAQEAGPGVAVVDSRDGVAKQALKVVGQGSGVTPGATTPPPARGSFCDTGFFVTQLRTASDQSEYQKLCASFGIPWCGVLEPTGP